MKHFDILIVDDERRYADMLARRLELRGCHCGVCYSGGKALEMLISAAYLLVVLDLHLPDLYGTEVLKQIKQNHSEVPVIVLTGHGTEKDRRKCMQLGALDFMHKPLDIEKLLDIWRQIRNESE